ncbi:LysM peptidoglycan-binding domain-containing protein [Candidatus Gracilibacteria bacterium]|nr:LysM peptidoglycan-binding domain-containing protein [Candidatus Gracilibacteria bacterium]
MGSKINLRARIERHSRVLHHNLYAGTKKSGKSGLAIISAIAVFLLPIYPSFAGLVNNSSATEFYRGDIDETSIISSYFGDDNTVGDGDVFIQSKDSFLYVSAVLDEDNRDVSGTKEVVEYEVKPGESVSAIASKFNITRNSIYWANDFESSHTIHPGDIIKVPPVSGLIHTVVSGETLGGLANKYDVESKDIMKQNLLLTANDLKVGDTIIIPGAEKAKPKPVVVPKKTYAAASTPSSGYSFTAKAQSEYVNTSGQYNLVWRSPYSGVWGNCTWYVASYKNVNWRGNANRWMENARAAGNTTGSSPSIGAIVQFEGRGYNPYYGHVGIVIDMTSTHIIVSDMNYRRLGEVTTRKVPINDRTIKGYIYVD